MVCFFIELNNFGQFDILYRIIYFLNYKFGRLFLSNFKLDVFDLGVYNFGNK